MFLYGGYSKVMDSAREKSYRACERLTATPLSITAKVADDEDKDLEHGKVCEDMWALDLNKFTVRTIRNIQTMFQRENLLLLACQHYHDA